MSDLYRLEVGGRYCGRFEEHDPAGYIAGMMEGVIMLESALTDQEWNAVVDSAVFMGEVPARLLANLDVAKSLCKI